jgi:hypothetical protein
MDSTRFVFATHRKTIKRASRRLAKTKQGSRSHTKAMKRLLRMELHNRLMWDESLRNVMWNIHRDN